MKPAPQAPQPPEAGRRRARVFFALWPDAGTRGRLAQAAQRLQATCGGRILKPDNIHLTLVFLGDVDRTRLDALRAAAAGATAPRHTLLLDRFGWFRRNRVAWAGPAQMPPALPQLVHRLEQVLRQECFSFDARAFEAHITLARRADCKEVPTLPEPIPWPVSEFVLVESELGERGSTYTIIGRWPLS